MDTNQRERLVNRILSRLVLIEPFTIHHITPEIKYKASEIFFDIYNKAGYHELMEDSELESYLLKHELWNPDKEEKLSKSLQKEIEDAKVGLYESILRADRRSIFREQIAAKEKELETLYIEKNSFSYLTRSGFANYVKSRYILSNIIYHGGKPYFFESDAEFERVLKLVNDARITEVQFRDLARNDPWRSYWGLGKIQPLFPYSVSEYSDEQRQLCLWSKMYDSVYESTDCPHTDVIDDDDMLDGWMIVQRRNREKELVKKNGEEFVKSQKIKNSGEVYVVCSKDDAHKVESLNDPFAAAIKRQRMNVLKERGEVKEMDMPDVKRDLMMYATNVLSQNMKG